MIKDSSCSAAISVHAGRRAAAALTAHGLIAVALAMLTGCMIEQPHGIGAQAPSFRSPPERRAALSPPPKAGVAYAIRNVGDGEVITGPKAVGDEFVGLDDDRGRTSQRWTLVPVGGGRTFQLRVTDVGFCLADHGRGVLEEACDATNQDQHWLIIPHAEHHEIMFRDNAHCLGITSRGKLIDSECHGDAGELWDFVAVSR